MLGKYVEDLQSGVSVEDDEIFGTLSYVTGYTGFSGDPALQEGNYLVLKFDTDDEDDVITVELTNGVTGHPVTLDSDRNMVIRVTDPRKQKLKVVVEHTNEDETVTTRKEFYDLHQLELLPKTEG